MTGMFVAGASGFAAGVVAGAVLMATALHDYYVNRGGR